MPSSRYFSVAGPNERSRSRRGGQHGGWVRHLRLDARAAHSHGLQVLRAHHGAEPAAAGVAAVVRHGGEPHQPLARGADRRDTPGRSEPLAQALLGWRPRQAPEIVRGLHPRALAVHEQHRGLLARAAHDDGVVACELALDGEVARRERVVQQACERRLRHHGELRARGERSADEGEKTNASGASGPSGSTSAGARRCISQVPSPAPPMQPRRTAPGDRAGRPRRCPRPRRARGRSSRPVRRGGAHRAITPSVLAEGRPQAHSKLEVRLWTIGEPRRVDPADG